MRAPLPLLLAGMVATLALAGPSAGQSASSNDAELNPARYRVAIADQPAATVLKKAESNASADAAIRDAQKMSKEFRPAAAPQGSGVPLTMWSARAVTSATLTTPLLSMSARLGF